MAKRHFGRYLCFNKNINGLAYLIKIVSGKFVDSLSLGFLVFLALYSSYAW